MNSVAPKTPLADPVAKRLTDEVKRSYLRLVKGVDYLTSPDPRVGGTPKDILYMRGTQRLVRYRPFPTSCTAFPY